MSDPTLSEVQEKIRKFAELRDWGQFHTPKNLAMAIGSEAGELLDTMLWVDGEQSRNPDDKTEELIKEEVADVMIYCLRICDVLSMDPIEIMNRKLEVNEEKYPVSESAGNATKYNRR